MLEQIANWRDWEFADPWFFVLLPLVFVVYGLLSRWPSSVAYSSLSLVEHIGKSWKLRFARLPALLACLGFMLLVVALARPRTPERETRISRDGIAIMMVVDLSSSMNARDLVEEDRSINRLDVVKDVFVDFVLGTEQDLGRQDDLIGLVTFAGYADSLCPLTLDHGNLVSIVNDLQIVSVESEDGTALGDGLGLAVERLRRSKAKSRVAILLTDGENNAGIISPERSADLAAEFDIKVYCIGAGTNGTALMPMRDFFDRISLRPMPVRIDEETLKQIARKTGGEYFRAQDREALAGIYTEIDSLERTLVSETQYLKYTEHFRYFVQAGLVTLVVAFLLNASIFRRLP